MLTSLSAVYRDDATLVQPGVYKKNRQEIRTKSGWKWRHRDSPGSDARDECPLAVVLSLENGSPPWGSPGKERDVIAAGTKEIGAQRRLALSPKSSAHVDLAVVLLGAFAVGSVAYAIQECFPRIVSARPWPHPRPSATTAVADSSTTTPPALASPTLGGRQYGSCATPSPLPPLRPASGPAHPGRGSPPRR